MSLWETLSVSRETLDRLEVYKGSLLLWNKKINLVSENSTKDVWGRHFLDSAQIFRHIGPADCHLLDIGSGGGLPGLVLGIMAKKKYPNLKITLVESDTRKAVFLKEVVRSQRLNSTVLSDRVEKLSRQNADIVTARAVAPLKTLLGYAYQHMSQTGVCIFLKGISYKNEVEEALDLWRFNISVDESITNEGSVVLKITHLERQNDR